MAKTMKKSTVMKSNNNSMHRSTSNSEYSDSHSTTESKSFGLIVLSKNYKIQIMLLFLISLFIKSINSHVCGFDNYPHKKPEILQMQANEDLLGEAENHIPDSLKLLEANAAKNSFLNLTSENDILKSSYDIKNLNNEDKRFLQTGTTTTSYLASTFTPIRIYFDYTTLDSQTASIDANVITGVKKILSNTQTIFQNILGVKRYNTKLRVRSCDQNIQIASNVKTGIDADIVIFPFFDTSLANTSTEAYATACIISSIDNRPVAGLIGISPKFSVTKTNWESYYTNLALHELSHVVVFNPNLFEFFRDKNGKAYNADEVIKNSIVNGMQRTSLAFPKVLETAKKHFKCDSLTGVELENQGGQGTASSHWEARLMLGDFMIGLSFDDTAISEITLALFEDSGWYSVNYYTGGLFKYGKNKGCDFLNKKCFENNTPLSNDEFCSTPYQSLCVSNLMSRGICYITDSSNPDDPNYRYFSKPSKGGLFMADYCPIIAVPTNSTYFYPWSCTDGLSTYPAEFDEKISQTSGCFVSNALRSSANQRLFSNSFRATCFQFQCDFNNSILSVSIGSQTVACPREGGQVQIPGYTGSLICPDFYKMCTNQAQCKDMMTCAMNKVSPYTAIFSYVPTNTPVPVNNSNTSTAPTVPTAPANTPTNPTTIVNPPPTPNTNLGTGTSTNNNPTTKPTPVTNPVIIPIVPPITVNVNVNTTINKPPIDYNKTLTKDDSVSNSAFHVSGNSMVSFSLILIMIFVF